MARCRSLNNSKLRSERNRVQLTSMKIVLDTQGSQTQRQRTDRSVLSWTSALWREPGAGRRPRKEWRGRHLTGLCLVSSAVLATLQSQGAVRLQGMVLHSNCAWGLQLSVCALWCLSWTVFPHVAQYSEQQLCLTSIRSSSQKGRRKGKGTWNTIIVPG